MRTIAMNKMRNILTILASKWYLLVAWLLFSVIIWSVIFTAVYEPRKEEKISIFVGTYYCDPIGMGNQLSHSLPHGIKKVSVQWFSNDDMLFGLYFATYGTLYSDIIILQESMITDEMCKTYFQALPNEYVDYRSTYAVDDAVYGIKISSTCPYIQASNGESLYLFFNKKSEHIYSINRKGTDGAIELAEIVLGL